MKTPAKPAGIIPNFNNPFRPFHPVKTPTLRPQTISFRPSVSVPEFPPNKKEQGIRPPLPPPPNTFSGLNQIRTFKPTTTFQQPSKAPPVFFHNEHSNVPTRVPVVATSRPSVMSAPVKPITSAQVSFIPNSILPETRGPVSPLKESPIKTTISPATQFFSANPDPTRFKPSPRIPINSLAGNVPV